MAMELQCLTNWGNPWTLKDLKIRRPARIVNTFLPKRAVPGKTYTFQLWQQCVKSKGHNVLITVTTGIASFLFEHDCMLRSLLGLVVDDNDSSHSTESSSS